MFEKFMEDLRSLNGNAAIQAPCSSGGLVQIEKVNGDILHLIYFEPNQNKPSQMAKTDIDTIEKVLHLAQRQAC